MVDTQILETHTGESYLYEPKFGRRGVVDSRGQKNKRKTFFAQSFSTTLRVMDIRAQNHGRPRQKVPFPAAGVMGEICDPSAPRRKGQELGWPFPPSASATSVFYRCFLSAQGFPLGIAA